MTSKTTSLLCKLIENGHLEYLDLSKTRMIRRDIVKILKTVENNKKIKKLVVESSKVRGVRTENDLEPFLSLVRKNDTLEHLELVGFFDWEVYNDDNYEDNWELVIEETTRSDDVIKNEMAKNMYVKLYEVIYWSSSLKTVKGLNHKPVLEQLLINNGTYQNFSPPPPSLFIITQSNISTYVI